MKDERDLDIPTKDIEVKTVAMEEGKLLEVFRVLADSENHQIQIRSLPTDPYLVGVILYDILANFAKAYSLTGVSEQDAASRISEGFVQAMEDPENRETEQTWRKELDS